VERFQIYLTVFQPTKALDANVVFAQMKADFHRLMTQCICKKQLKLLFQGFCTLVYCMKSVFLFYFIYFELLSLCYWIMLAPELGFVFTN